MLLARVNKRHQRCNFVVYKELNKIIRNLIFAIQLTKRTLSTLSKVNILMIKIIFDLKVYQDSSRKCSAWKDLRIKPLSFLFPPQGQGEVWQVGGEYVLNILAFDRSTQQILTFCYSLKSSWCDTTNSLFCFRLYRQGLLRLVNQVI